MSTFESALKSGKTAAPMRGLAALVSAVRSALRVGIARVVVERCARRNLQLLGQFADRDLKDIGLTRSDLARLARDPAGRSGIRLTGRSG